MALVQIPPVEASVRWSRAANRPASVRWNGRDRRVVDLDAVRDERSAYPAQRGPRVTFVVRMDDGSRLRVAFDPVRRCWFLEAVEKAA